MNIFETIGVTLVILSVVLWQVILHWLAYHGVRSVAQAACRSSNVITMNGETPVIEERIGLDSSFLRRVAGV